MMSSLLPVIIILLACHYYFFLLKILFGLKKLSASAADRLSAEVSFNKISVIIPFRNEEENILASLRSIESQDFPEEKFEVIYVNDGSTDSSLQKLCSAVSRKNVKVLTVPKHYSENQNKKRAVRYGLENSGGDIIMTTDADCIHSPKWISTMMSMMKKETGFISGPVIFSDENNSFNRFQKIEFAGLVLTGAGLIASGNPIICNAANIAYRREAYNKVNGFEYKHSLSSGDDELLMQKIKKETEYEIEFCMNKDALTETGANKTIGQFYNQRKRWASKGLFYNDKALIIKLILIFLFYLSLPVQFIMGLFNPFFLITLAILFVIKMITEYAIIRQGTRTIFPGSVLKNFISAELLHVPYIIIAGISGVFGNYSWKGRQIKR